MFKQLIMVAGFDRYFQIAPCFRDEDARADRSPGEFYQLDFEMSFVTQDDVFNAIEPVLSGVFEEFADGRSVTPAGEYPRIPYREALLKYGSDKPDLRNPLIIAIVLAMACALAPFSPAFVPITFALFLLGLGWNFCFVGGSSLLADQLSPDERARTQGFNDLLMGLVAASGSFLSGHIFAALGYGTMGLLSAALAVAPLLVAAWWHFAASAATREVARAH